MLDSKTYISTQIENKIPQYIRFEYPSFVEFIKKYYEWMESIGAPYHFISNVLNFSDVDRTSLEFLDIYARNFLQPLPDIIYDQNNLTTIVKNIEQYYSARGSEKAFRFLFRLFEYKDDSGKEVEFYYPSYDMLRISDGKWVENISIKIIDPPENIIEFESGLVFGETSKAQAVINEIKLYNTTGGIAIAEIFLINFDVIHTTEKFIVGETINLTSNNGNTYQSIIEPILNDIIITNAGTYNIIDQKVIIDDTNIGEDAMVVISSVNSGSITDFTIIHGGSQYQVNDKVYTEDNFGFGSGAYGKVDAVDGTGAITSIKLISGGNGYTHNQNVNINSKNGTKALIMIESDSIGSIRMVDIINYGIHYNNITSTLSFNNILRIYDLDFNGFVGEQILGDISGTTGVIEYWDTETNLISVRVNTGNFVEGENIIGQTVGWQATIYDISIPTGVLSSDIKCVSNYSGKYLNMDGHISSLKYIQDSYFYQMFSYMIKTKESKDVFEQYINNSHPAGSVVFSYKDNVLQYFRESYGGFISPYLETTEMYKFKWYIESYSTHGNTQIKQYSDIIIDDIVNINNNNTEKTGFTYGSEITII